MIFYKKLLILLFVFSFIFSSCTYFSEPEPYVDKEAKPPEIKPYTLNNYSINQVMSGNIELPFIPDVDISEIDHVTLFIDYKIESTIYNSPYLFDVDTRKWPNSLYTLAFCVYKKKNSLGLMGLVNSPSQVYTISLVFDNTPPTAPTNVAVINKNNHPSISWTPTNLNNFYCYVVRRDGNVIATLFSQNTSVYDDTIYSAGTDFYRVIYDIGASTMDDTAYSQVDTLGNGESLSIRPITNALDDLDDRIILQANNLISVSTQNHEVINQYSLSGNGIFSKNLDNTKFIYCQKNIPYCYEFEVKTLNLLRKQFAFYINENVNAIAIGTGYYAMYFSIGNELHIVANDWSIYSPCAYFDGPGRYLSVSPDVKSLLVVDNKGIKSYSLNGESTPLKVQSSITDRIELFRADWKNSRIFVTRQNRTVEVWDTQTLNPIGSFQLSISIPSANNISAISVSSKNLYVAYTIYYNNSPASILAEYDIATKQQKRFWTFSSMIQSLLGSENGLYLFACTSMDQWIVDVGGGQ
jgi:hypothetical protein